MEKIIVIGRTDLLSNVVLPKLCGAISCIIQSLKSLFLPMSNSSNTVSCIHQRNNF